MTWCNDQYDTSTKPARTWFLFSFIVYHWWMMHADGVLFLYIDLCHSLRFSTCHHHRIQNLMLYPSLSDPWRTVWLAAHSYNCWILTVCRRKRETGLNSWHHHRAASSPLGYPCPMTAVWKPLVTVIQFSSCQSLHSLRVSVSLYIITLLTALLYPRHSGATIKNSTVVQN